MSSKDELSIVSGEPISVQPGRILTGWLDDEESVAALLGRNRRKGDDLSPIRQRIEDARAARKDRPVFVPGDAVVQGDARKLLAAADRNDLKTSFAGIHWTVEMIDMARVQSVQKAIKVGAAYERIAPVLDDAAKLWEFCLPTERTDPPRGAFTDIDQRGYTISSLNPNLRIAGSKVDTVEIVTPTGPIKVQGVMFFVNFGNSFMNVARHEGRYFLRDGYHRAVGLLKAGITRMPCVVVQLPGGFDELMPGRQTFSRDVCFSDRPPLVCDFIDDTVADDYQMAVTRKIIRIRSEEFLVQG